MTPSLKWSSGAILLFFLLLLPTHIHAATLFQLNNGTTLQKIGVPNIEDKQGATSTALFNASAGSVVYINYCLNLTNQTVSALAGQQGTASSTYSAPIYYAEDSYSIPGDGGTQQICHTSTTTIAQDVQAGRDYFLEWTINGVHSGATWDMNSTNDYLYVTDTPINPQDDTTHIIDSVPGDQAVVATTTNSLGAKINVNTNQWVKALAENSGNWYLQVTLRKFIISFTGTSTCSQGNIGCLVPTTRISQPPITYIFPITNSGMLNFATTTDTSKEGTYQLNMQIIQNNGGFLATLLPWFGFGTTVLDAKGSTFYVSNATVTSTTTFGSITQPATTTDDIIAAALALANKKVLDKCADWTRFDIADCINALMIPRADDYGPIMDIFANSDAGLFTYAPWGYATRVVKIFNSTATSSFPEFAAYIPDPVTHQAMWFRLDINEMFTGAAAQMDSIRDPVTGDNPRDGLEQIVRSILALSVVSFIFYDLVGGKKNSTKHNLRRKTKLS